MKIVVCMKYVPDTATVIKTTADRKSVDLAEASFVVNPYDEYAVEEALQIKEKQGGEVIILSAAADKATAGLRTCLAMGADSAVIIQNASLDNADSYVIGSALARVLQDLKPDLILFGKSSYGADNGQVPAVVAEKLDLPQISVVVKLEAKDGKFKAEREIEGAKEIVEGSLPAVFTAQKGLNTPRYASLKGIMAAKKKPIETRTLESLGLPADELQPRMNLEEICLPPSRPPGKVLTGDPSITVPELVKLLHEEAKII